MEIATSLGPTIRSLLQEADSMLRRGRLDQAETLCRRALRSRAAPSDSLARVVLLKLGLIFQRQGRTKEAAQAYQDVLKVKVDGSDHDLIAHAAYRNLATIWKKLGRLNDARQCYDQALKFRPDAGICYNLGNTLRKLGQFKEAREAYERALAIDPDFEPARLALCIAEIPIVHSSTEEIHSSRRRYRERLEALSDRYAKATVEVQSRAAADGFLQPFYLAYQGLNDRDLQKTYGEMICRLMSARYPYWSHQTEVRPRSADDKVRVGLVSAYFFGTHSVWKIPLRGWVENLDRSKFEIFGYHTRPRPADTQAASALFSNFVRAPLSIEGWCEAIARDGLDVLIFSDFGMDPETLQLGCLRLAPIQINALAHPVTSGLPTIDYCLSSELMEPENVQDHYTEEVIRLPNLGFCYKPLGVSVESELGGVTRDHVLFWCAQSLFKYLPEHDDVFPRIARKLVQCKFYFIEDLRNEGQITNIFRVRLKNAFRHFGLAADDFCVFLQHMTTKEFARICATADVFLDSIGWSGNNSTHEAIAQNLPVVTMPTDLMRGRHTMAILKMIGLEETIAATKDDYIRIAIELARDPAYRQRISQRIAENKHKLYGDLTPIRALEDFLWREVQQSRRGPGTSFHAGDAAEFARLTEPGPSEDRSVPSALGEPSEATPPPPDAAASRKGIRAAHPAPTRHRVGRGARVMAAASAKVRSGRPRPDGSMFERSILIVAHPDDEVLWFSSVLGRVDEVILCFMDVRSNLALNRGRRTLLSQYPMKNVSTLDLPQPGLFNRADWSRPVVTEFGLEVDDRADARCERSFLTLKAMVRPRLAGYLNVFTHNPWGEYGHEEHVQLHRVIDSLKGELGFALWCSNYCSNRSMPLAAQYINGYASEYITFDTNRDLAHPIIKLYQKRECWTWYDDWEMFQNESFLESSSLVSGSHAAQPGHLFPLNFLRVDF